MANKYQTNFAKYFPGTEQIVIPPGTSMQFNLPADTQADWVLKFVWQEVTP